MLAIYPRPEEFIGKEVDGHRIDAVLGRGGMGIVFKAENIELSRTVALKIINPALAQDESFLRRFRSEARALAQIHHPNIVIVYDFRSFDMGFYISMEYVEGLTLADYLEEKGPIPWKEGIYLTKQMLSAFHYAHSCGVIHRDIKPRNILLTKNNVVKITDFGLAKVLEEGKRTTDTTVTMATGGTIHYMPPEQIRGLRNVDHRGDIFSLGMTMYEAIAGMLPFDKNASGYTIQKMIVEEPFPDIRKRVASIPRPLAKIIMKSLEKEPHKRYQSAAEMISALEEFELNQSKSSLVLNGSGNSYAAPAQANNRWKVYAGMIALGVVMLFFVAMFSPGGLGGIFSKGSHESPTLAEQVLAQPNSTTKISKAEAAPLSDLDVDPVNIENSPAESNGEDVAEDSTATVDVSDNPATPPPAETSTTANIGSVSFDSEPKGAQVYLDGVFVGATPLFLDNVKTGSASVELRLDNHKTYKSSIQVRPFQISRISGELAPITGLLTLNITPASELYVNGRLIRKDAEDEVRLPLLATTHEITVLNPQFGEWKKSVSLSPSDSLGFDVDFTQSVRLIITAFDTADNGMHAQILLDGEPSGFYTPTPFEIPVGVHTIEVQSDGFEMVEEAQEVNYDSSTKGPLRFILRKSN